MSKGLEALKEMIKYCAILEPQVFIIEKELKEGELAISYVNAIFDIFSGNNNGDFIIDIIERQKKALEIIKEKVVDIYLLYATKTFEDYNSSLMQYNANLTQEEYDLLKEMLL